MSNVEIVGLIVSILGVGCFAAVFTILYMTYSKSTINEYQNGKRDIEIIDEAIYDNLSNVKKRRKIIKTIKSIGFYGLMIIIIPFFIFSLVNKVSGNITMINDRGIIVVASGSMSEKNEANHYIFENNLDDQFDTYSIIVVEKVENDSDLELYDVISYVNNKGVNYIHRIIGIHVNSNGVIEYETRGDSNDATDTYRPTLNDIKGKYTGEHVPVIGMFVLFMQSSIGMITILSLIYCLLMIDYFTNKIIKTQNQRLDKLSKAIDYSKETETGIMKANYVETILYKGFSYKFDENGFIDKEEILNKEYIDKSSSSMIQILEDKETNEVISEKILININDDGKEEK